MNIFRVSYKLVLAGYVISRYLIKAYIILKSEKDDVILLKRISANVSVHCELLLKLLDFKLHLKNMPSHEQHFLTVGNHVGFFEIFALASIRRNLYITSVEMRDTPFLGLLTKMGGCLYVERRDRSNIQNEMLKIREKLQQGFNVVLYPEGTSSDGSQVLPFKKTLMTAAAGTGVPILPVTVNFLKVNGEPMSHKWRDYVFWYGDMTFFPAMLRALSLRSVELELDFAEPVYCHSEEERKVVVERVYSEIVSRFKPIPQMRRA
jgi:1-acyl-sn-glycerol-3-phosphate acyltransferase